MSDKKPTVLIVGAGLGGLMLGALLEKSGVPYTIFERAAVVKPLGSAMSVGPTLLPIFQQLGIYDEFLTIGKYGTHTETYRESLEPYKPTDHRPVEDFTGYGQYIIARPSLYALILKQVPAHKIHFSKRVVTITEQDDKVTIQTADNSTYEGDILVGADGAYSSVRQSLYEKLKKEGKLPESDQEDLPFSCTCLVGQTKVLDPEQFPVITERLCKFMTVLGNDKPYSWAVITTAQNTLVYSIIEHLDKTTSKAAMEKQSGDKSNSQEWGSNPTIAMCNETRAFNVPLGNGKRGTLGDLYDLTPKDMISKVMLEEKVFETWHHGRTVLLGDACHKLHPSGGHGAVTAFHDAIALANLIYAAPSSTLSDVTYIFENYHKERLPAVLESFKNSQLMAKFMEKSLTGSIVLFLITHMPMWLWRIVLSKTVRYRPQVGFLPSIPLQGTVVPFVSPSEQKARAVFEKRHESAAAL
ncbi:hypothetical protein EC991_011287 [Linnemannia zychae]|nr:hypothetical protein EC991_011287 [Linnemannia zychae]